MAHCYAIGATRTGKSNWLLDTIREPFAFIDKHGNAARQLADAYPCIYWRPADLSFPVGFNPLANVPADLRWKETADIVSVFADIWHLGEQTPRLLYYLRSALRLALDSRNATLLDVRRILSDSSYRADLLRRCTDSQTRETWKEFTTKPARQQAEEVSSLQNKVAALADPLPLRYIIGQPSSTIDFRRLIETGTNLVLDLSDLGDEPAALIGALVINAMKQAADTFTEPKPYHLVIDEFQNFGTGIVSTILSESGKRGLDLTLAHQFISQLEEEVRDAVLGNCSTLVSFRVGAGDAQIIGRALDVSPKSLMELTVGEAWVRQAPGKALPMQTKLARLPTGLLDRNIRYTRSKYARPRKAVERVLGRG